MSSKKANELSQTANAKYDRFGIVSERPSQINEGTPDFLATKDGYLVDYDFEDLKSPFSKLVSQDVYSQLDELLRRELLLNESGNSVGYGHQVIGRHHYDVTVDLRSLLRKMDYGAQVFAIYLRAVIIQSKSDYLIYPEHSELYELVSQVNSRYRGGEFQKIPVIIHQERASLSLSLNDADGIEGKSVTLLDEGVFSGKTMIALLQAVLSHNPLKVSVLVWEVRADDRQVFKKLIEVIKASAIDVSLYCIAEYDAPSWSKSNCPYCEAGVPMHLESGQSLVLSEAIPNPTNTSVDFKTKLSVLMYFLSELNSGRKRAIEALEFAKRLDLKDSSTAVVLCAYALYNFRKIINLNLRNELLSLFEQCLRTPRLENIHYLLAVLSQVPIPSKYKFLQIAVQRCALKVNFSNELVVAFQHLVTSQPSLLHILRETLARENIEDEDTIQEWNRINISDNEIWTYNEALRAFLNRTKVHRIPNHLAITDVMASWSKSMVVAELANLELLAERINMNTASDLRLAKSFLEPEGFANLLKDNSWIEEFVTVRCTNAANFLSSFHGLDEIKGDGGTFLNYHGSVETWLLAMTANDASLISQTILDNLDKGAIEVITKLKGTKLELHVVCKNSQIQEPQIVKTKLESLNYLKFAQPSSSIDKNGKLIQTFKMEIIGHVDVNRFCLRR